MVVFCSSPCRATACLQEATKLTEAELAALAEAGCNSAIHMRSRPQLCKHVNHIALLMLQALIVFARQGGMQGVKDCITAGAQVDRPSQACHRRLLPSPAPACLQACHTHCPGNACLQNRWWWTALHTAAEHGWLKCLKELLGRGVAVDHADNVRWPLLARTALDAAP